MKKTDIVLHSDVPVEQLVRQSVTAMLGKPELYEVNTEETVYDSIYCTYEEEYNVDTPSLIFVKALRTYMKANSLDYAELVYSICDIFYDSLNNYDFSSSEEFLEEDIKTGMLRLSHGNYNDLKLDRLIKSGVSGLKRWRFVTGDFKTQSDPLIPYNFFTYIFQNLFNVDPAVRSHIIVTLPNIVYPSMMLESYIYLRSLRMPEMHFDKTCQQAINKYNKSLSDVDPDTDFLLQTYPITQSEYVDEALDRKARIHEPYEPMLLLFLCFSASCNNDEIIWDVMPYYEMYGLIKNVMSFKRDDGTIIAGRIVSDNFYSDMRRAVFIKIQSTASKKETVEVTSSVFTGLDVVKPSSNEIFAAVNDEIVNFMASGLPSSMWAEGSELPASWIALL